jgi:hypothetical protein
MKKTQWDYPAPYCIGHCETMYEIYHINFNYNYICKLQITIV